LCEDLERTDISGPAVGGVYGFDSLQPFILGSETWLMKILMHRMV
jgi:hypothetical protein